MLLSMDMNPVTVPVGRLTMDAPWRWLGAGWRDLWTAPALSLGYGIAVTGGGALIIFALGRSGLAALIPMAFGIFAIVGPLLAVGLYEMSRRIEEGAKPALFPIRFPGPRSPLQLAFVGIFILLAAFIWVLVAMVLYSVFSAGIFLPPGDFVAFAISTPNGLIMTAVGTVMGGIIAFAIFLLTVVSIPMLMNERTDAFTAIAEGVKAFKSYPAVMALWAWLICIVLVGGVASFFVGLTLAFPLLGHATWHAYRDIRGRS